MIAYWIYLLSDPETHEPRYVGRTQDPAGRAMWHRSRPRKTTMPSLDEWFAELRAKGLRPKFSELACISGHDDETVTEIARKVERGCIQDYASSTKGRLLNIDWNKYRADRNHANPLVRMSARAFDHILPSQEAIVT